MTTAMIVTAAGDGIKLPHPPGAEEIERLLGAQVVAVHIAGTMTVYYDADGEAKGKPRNAQEPEDGRVAIFGDALLMLGPG